MSPRPLQTRGVRASCSLAALLGLAIASALPSALAQTPSPGDLVINEIMYDPPTGGSGNEWIEITNRSSQTFDLQGLVVTDASSSSPAVPASVLIGPGEFVVFAGDASAFAATYPGVAFIDLNLPALNNSGDHIALVVGATEIDVVPYQPSWGGTDASLERRDPFGPSSSASNFGTTSGPAGGTPGAQNTLFSTDQDPPTLNAVEAVSATTIRVTFSEPVGGSAGVPANYEVSGSSQVTAANPASDPTVADLTVEPALTGPAEYTLTVRNVADLRGNAMTSESATFFFGTGDAAASRDLVINEFLYDEPASNSPGEFVELVNRSDKTFDLREFTLNDGTGDDEPITDQAVFIGPGEYAVIVEDGPDFQAVFAGVPFIDQPTWSALNNSGDAIVLKYQGTTIDSLTYTSAWNGVDLSLERKDPEGASVRSNFLPTTDPRGGTPGAENSQFAPDVTGPQLAQASGSSDGRVVIVELDEPATQASVSASAFSISGATILEAAYDGDVTVSLTLTTSLPTGTYTVTATGLTDALGNVTAQTSTTFEYTADETSPAVASAVVLEPTRVSVSFTEPVTLASASPPAVYQIDGGIGSPSQVNVDVADGLATGATLDFAAALQDRVVYTLTVTGLEDPTGNLGGGTASLFFGTPDTPQPGDILINELMFDPQDGSDGEYVELANTTTDRVFDLRQLALGEGPIASTPAVLTPGQILAVVRDTDAFVSRFPSVPFIEADSFDGLSNGGDTVVLRAGNAVIDSVAYDPDWHRPELDDATGIALERRDSDGPSSAASNWTSSLDERGGTPSATNSVGVADGGRPDGTGAEITSPFAPDDGEAARISYTLSAEASLVRARIYDAGGRFVRELEPGRLTGREGSLLWDGRGETGEQLRVGYYVVLVEAVDTLGGTTERYTATVVLARR
ncbi:MAG: lamin tail domain-containing protein [Bacteroidota bacterium]